MQINKGVIIMEKKNYEAVLIEIVAFDEVEVLAASGYYADDDDPNGLPIAPAK